MPKITPSPGLQRVLAFVIYIKIIIVPEMEIETPEEKIMMITKRSF